jgi:uncharacterized protein YodC (DUF2158 family)
VKDIKVGDIVELRSGGPPMVVEDVGILDTSPVTCVWFDGNKRESGNFVRQNLVASKAKKQK